MVYNAVCFRSTCSHVWKCVLAYKAHHQNTNKPPLQSLRPSKTFAPTFPLFLETLGLWLESQGLENQLSSMQGRKSRKHAVSMKWYSVKIHNGSKIPRCLSPRIQNILFRFLLQRSTRTIHVKHLLSNYYFTLPFLGIEDTKITMT